MKGVSIFRCFLQVSILVVVNGCYPEGDKFIGDVHVDGVDTYFKVFQEYPHDMEPSLGVSYSIVKGGKHLSRKYHLTGCLDWPVTLDYFTTGIHDSIIYLTFIDSSKVYAMYDLKNSDSYPCRAINDSWELSSSKEGRMFSVLYKNNSNLKRP